MKVFFDIPRKKRIESLDVDSKEFVSKAKLYIPSTEKCYWKNSKNLEL